MPNSTALAPTLHSAPTAQPASALDTTFSPFDLPAEDPIDTLGERIALLSAQIQAATYQLLVLIHQFDLRGGWDSGFRTCAHWLNWRTGLSLPAAREKVRVARALPDLPRISQAMSEGRLSFSKARAITRVATPDNEDDLLLFAEAGTAAHVERLVRAWRRVDQQAEIDDDARRHASRQLSAWIDDDGMLVLRGRLSAEAGAVLLRALDAAEERLYDLTEESKKGDITATQRRADALGLIAESALTHDLDSGTRGDRYQVIVHVDAPVLSSSRPNPPDEHGHPVDSDQVHPEPPRKPGQSVLQDGQRVSAETSRRLACDASTLEMLHHPDGRILDVGRRTRTIPTPIRRALDHRDHSCCRFPGCQVQQCDAHHVDHWADGGETKLGNLVLLCRKHHRAVHEEGFGVSWEGEELRFYWPNGRRLEEAPGMPGMASRGWDLAMQLAEEGVAVAPGAGMPSWEGGSVDYQWALDRFR